MTEEIIALDLETTGLNPRTDQILELGAARIRNGRVEDTYAAFINIGKKIPEFIVGLTGITGKCHGDHDSLTHTAGKFIRILFDPPFRLIDADKC